ncbi:acyl carrier protein [Streptomyces microflavus]|uniref:acyl carrier protein n=1 Tax=Streptomyces microflavus TaxID=1919 RepID=UPI0037F6A6CB
MPEVRDQIRSFIIKEILKGGSEDDLPNDLDLRESGVLTSLTTMQLVSFVEDEFGIDVALQDPRLHFTTVAHLTQYVKDRQEHIHGQ